MIHTQRTSLWPKKWLRAFWGAALATGVVSSSAWTQDEKIPAPAEVKKADEAKKTEEPKKVEATPVVKQKGYVIDFEDKPWSQVIQWYGETTGLAFISATKPPTGTIRIKTPLGRKYTIGEVTDIINSLLIQQNFVLVRGEKSFFLFAADEKINPSLLPRVDEKGLMERGESELVQFPLKLTTVDADTLKEEIKPLMGPFKEIVSLASMNTLILTDNSGNLRRILAMVKEMESGQGAVKEANITYKCVYINCRDAEKILREQLGDPAKLLLQASMALGASRGGDPRGGDPRGGDPRGGDPRAMATMSQAMPKFKPFYISTNELQNTVIVTGPADKVAQAKTLLEQIDKGGKPRIDGYTEPSFMTYNVPSGMADNLSKTLGLVYGDSKIVKISPLGSSQLMVYGLPQDHMDIVGKIREVMKPSTTNKLIPLNGRDAAKTEALINSMLGVSGPTVKADEGGNGLLVRGTPEQIAEVEAIIKLGDPDAVGGGTGNLRIITVESGSASVLAEQLQKMMQQMGKEPPRFINPNAPEPKAAPAPKAAPKEEPKNPAYNRGTPNARDVANIAPADFVLAQLVDPQAKPADQPQQPAPKSGGTMTVIGNKLIINSDDPATLALLQQTAKLLMADPSPSDFRVIRLKNANATDAARVIDQLFNNTDLQQQQGGRQGGGNPFGGGGSPFGGGGSPFGGGGSPFGGRGGGGGGGLGAMMAQLAGGGAAPANPANPAAAANPAKNKVRVVAYPETNVLIVRASALDFATIKGLLSEYIDSYGEEDGYQRVHFIDLQHADASTVASIIKDVYKESTGSSSSGGGAGGFTGFSFGNQGGGSTRGGATGGGGGRTTLAIGVDTVSNKLVVNCPQPLFENIEILCKKLDDAAKDNTKLVKYVQIKGVDPFVVQQAIEAMQGRTITQRSSTGRQFGGGQGGGFGQGGGSPFGGGGSPFGGGGSPFGGGQGGFGQGGVGQGMGMGMGLGAFGQGGGGRGGMGQGGGGMGQGGGGRGGMGGGRGGGGPGGGNQRQPERQGDPRFFDSRVMDDRGSQLLFDPSEERELYNTAEARAWMDQILTSGVQQASYQQPAAGQPAAAQPAPKGVVQPSTGVQIDILKQPRAAVGAQSLDTLGGIVISANNPADLQATLELIEYIIKNAKQTETKIEILHLENADATNVTNIVQALLQRVQIGVSSTTVLPVQTGGLNQFLGQQNSGAIFLRALPRFNAILIAAPEARMEDIKKQIKQFDVPNTPNSQPMRFALRKAAASKVATLIQNFFNQRYGGETSAQDQVRITFDESTNSIFVQAAPADMEEIKGLIDALDGNVSSAVNELKIVRIRNAAALDLAEIISRALVPSIVPSTGSGSTGLNLATTQIGQVGQGGGGAQGGALGGNLQQQNQLNPLLQRLQQGTGGGGGGGATQSTAVGVTTKSTSLRFIGKQGIFESGYLEDVHLTADPRTNTIIISAPEPTVKLLMEIIKDLDTVSPIQSGINVFPLKKADAVQTATILQQMFQGASATGNRAGAVAGTAFGQAAGGTGTTGSTRPLLSLSDSPADGANLLDIRITVDERTNSVIVAGTSSDLATIGAIIAKLEDTDVTTRQNSVYRLKFAAAADVATVLTTYFTNSLAVYTNANQLTDFQAIVRNIVVVAEPVTNNVLISATPQYFAQVMELVQALDIPPETVHINVMIASVTLNNSEEFGVEIGLQTPVFFNRSLVNGTTSTYTGAAGSSVPVGTVVNNVTGLLTNALQFNNNPNNALYLPQTLYKPQTVAFQGLGNLGVGRTGPNGVGGFVFSAGNDTLNVLVRALKQQGRVDIMNCPSIQTVNNQTGAVQVGQNYPNVSGFTVNANTGQQTPLIEQVATGVNLKVTPRVNPDGRILMRVEPSIVTPTDSLVPLGNGQFATAFDVQSIQTTVLAGDGETIVLGGLLTKLNERRENKFPILGDLPGVGVLFRYRTQNVVKSELIMVLTPHIVRSDEEQYRILERETAKMHWNLKDVNSIYGFNPERMKSAGSPVPAKHSHAAKHPDNPTAGVVDVIPLESEQKKAEAPKPLPKGAVADAKEDLTLPPEGKPAEGPKMIPVSKTGETETPAPAPAEEKKERKGWNPFKRN